MPCKTFPLSCFLPAVAKDKKAYKFTTYSSIAETSTGRTANKHFYTQYNVLYALFYPNTASGRGISSILLLKSL